MKHRLKENNEVLIFLEKRIELLENQLSNNWKVLYFFYYFNVNCSFDLHLFNNF